MFTHEQLCPPAYQTSRTSLSLLLVPLTRLFCRHDDLRHHLMTSHGNTPRQRRRRRETQGSAAAAVAEDNGKIGAAFLSIAVGGDQKNNTRTEHDTVPNRAPLDDQDDEESPASIIFQPQEEAPSRTFFPYDNYDSDDDDYDNEQNLVLHENSDDTTNRIITITEYYALFLQKTHWLWLIMTIFWLWPTGLFHAFPAFCQAANASFDPPPNSLAAVAQRAWQTNFENDKNSNNTNWLNDPLRPPIFLVLQQNPNLTEPHRNALINNTTQAYVAARNYLLGLEDVLAKHCFGDDDDGNHKNVPSSSCHSSSKDEQWHLTSFYSVLENQNLPWMARTLWSLPASSNKEQPPAVLASLDYRNKNMETDLLSILDDYQTSQEEAATTHNNMSSAYYFSTHVTGHPAVHRDWTNDTRRDIKRMDMMVLPLALLLMGLVLRHARWSVTWLVPLFGLVTTVAAWSVVMNYITVMTQSIQISHMTPTLMMSLTLAMGLDYSLFSLARFLEKAASDNTGGGQHYHPSRPPLSSSTTTTSRTRRTAAVTHMLRTAGPVLAWSGLTLATTFVGLIFMPLSMIRSVGIGASVTISCAVVVHWTIVPALLCTPLGTWIVKKKKQPPSIETNNSSSLLDNGVELNSPLLLENASQERLVTLPLPPPSSTSASSSTQDVVILDTPNSLWHRLAQHLLHPYKGIIVLLVTLQFLLPVFLHAGDLRTSLRLDLFLPTDSPAWQTMSHIADQVGWGSLLSYRILFDGHGVNQSMTSASGFGIMQRVVEELEAVDAQVFRPSWEDENDLMMAAAWGEESGVTHMGMTRQEENNLYHDLALEMDRSLQEWVEEDSNGSAVSYGMADTTPSSSSTIKCSDEQPSSTQSNDQEENHRQLAEGEEQNHHHFHRTRTMYNGISVIHNARVPYAIYASARACMRQRSGCQFQMFRTLWAIQNKTTTSDHYATVVSAALPVDPFSDRGLAWLPAARATIQRLQDGGALEGVKVYIHGPASLASDAVEAVQAAFPTIMLWTMVAVFFLMAVFFQSIVAPLRSVVSIALSVGFAFGLTSLVSKGGGIGPILVGSGGEVSWLIPPMSFSIMVGLALDYDVFLMSRILEYREEGYEHASSIAAGLHATGSIITAAGTIMALSFGSLMFLSSSPCLVQWSFLLTSAVLLDTFVVRTLVVPIVTSLTGSRWAWWPKRNLPAERYRLAPHASHSSETPPTGV